MKSMRSAGLTPNAAEGRATTWARPGRSDLLDRFAERHPHTDRAPCPIRRRFGIRAFGVNGFSASAGESLIVPQSDGRYEHEDLYVVMRGRIEADCDGERMERAEGEDVVRASARLACEHGARDADVLLAIGGAPGAAYAPPAWPPGAEPR